jgi:hypothetical protein
VLLQGGPEVRGEVQEGLVHPQESRLGGGDVNNQGIRGSGDQGVSKGQTSRIRDPNPDPHPDSLIP